MILMLGALLGFISVAFGAYTDHGLRDVVSDDQLRSLMTAIRYNQVHAVVIVAIGLAIANGGKLSDSGLLRWSGILFIAGTMLFSISIYLSAVLSMPGLTIATPFGGITLMAGWLSLIGAGIQAIGRP